MHKKQDPRNTLGTGRVATTVADPVGAHSRLIVFARRRQYARPHDSKRQLDRFSRFCTADDITFFASIVHLPLFHKTPTKTTWAYLIFVGGIERNLADFRVIFAKTDHVADRQLDALEPVSYTHLTLPTILRV